MADVADSCLSIVMFSWFYNSRIGTDWTCCDTCCRCTCCDDKGALPEEEQQGANKATAQGNTAQEDAAAAPPKYEETPAMKVPNNEQIQQAENQNTQTATAPPSAPS
ncbi:unnamed protein product [Sympodiomycopsis kandeliae]